MPADDVLFLHVCQTSKRTVGKNAPERAVRLLLVRPCRDVPILDDMPGKDGQILPEVLVRAVVVGELAYCP